MHIQYGLVAHIDNVLNLGHSPEILPVVTSKMHLDGTTQTSTK